MPTPVLIVYSSSFPNALTRLMGKIQNLQIPILLEKVHSISQLVSTLSKNRTVRPVVFLHVADRSEMGELLDLKDLLGDKRIVLLLPDESRQTYKDGLKIYPRYLATLNESPDIIAEILGLMLLLEVSTCPMNESEIAGRPGHKKLTHQIELEIGGPHV